MMTQIRQFEHHHQRHNTCHSLELSAFSPMLDPTTQWTKGIHLSSLTREKIYPSNFFPPHSELGRNLRRGLTGAAPLGDHGTASLFLFLQALRIQAETFNRKQGFEGEAELEENTLCLLHDIVVYDHWSWRRSTKGFRWTRLSINQSISEKRREVFGESQKR